MTPRLSIVVAVDAGLKCLPALLDALRPQCRGDVEVLLCHPADCDVAAFCRGEAWVTAVASSAESAIPHLWRDGIRSAEAPRVALSVVHCRPTARWVEGLCAADLDTYAGIGGAIANAPDADALDWAIFLLRYQGYAPPFAFRETADLPGDNAVYDRGALGAHAAAFDDGFWEPGIHARLLAEGRRLGIDPALEVVHCNGYTAGEFARQRLVHGRRFGRDRAAAMPRGRQWLYALASPAAPLVLGAKVVLRALADARARRHLPRALPHLLFFVAAWGLGEVRGALDAALRR